ncbi:MAG: SCO family protein [Sediminibacterium sp.]|jgi:protein SCO1
MVHYRPRNVCQFRIKLLLLFFFGINLLSCSLVANKIDSLPYYNSQDLTPIWNSNNAHRIAKFNLFDQRGSVYNSDSLSGKIYIASFFFTTCPSICPRMTKCLKTLQDSIANMQNVEIVSFSVMPWVDSINKLKVYGKENNINPVRWHLLTGEKSMIYSLGRASFFADNNQLKDTSTFIHTDKMFLIDIHQHIRGVFNATNMDDIVRVLNDIKILKKEI